MKKLRIAQVTNLQESVPPLNKNGLEMVVHYLTEELVTMGHDVTLFATADSQTSATLVPMWPTAVSRDPYGHWETSSAYTKWTVAEALRRHGEFDIIHDHTRFIAPFFAQLITTPIVTTVHHPISTETAFKTHYPADYQPYYENTLKYSLDTIPTVVVSKFQQAELFSARGLSSTVIYNGITAPAVSSSEPGEYLAFLGYLTAAKGADQAIQAVLPTGEKLQIAGSIRQDDPSGQDYFAKKIQPFLSDRISYVGGLGYQEKFEFLAKAKGLLLPIQWDEPFGLVAIEALAVGTPVIAWNRAAMPEIIVDGVSGFLVNSVSELTQRLGQIDSISRLACRARFEELFSARTMAKNYETFYYSLLK